MRLSTCSSSSGWARVLGLVLGAAVLAAPVLAADFKPFPDEWFFDGSKRPAVLKSQEGKPATEIQTQKWIGESLSIKEQRGKVVVIDFWATWCGPCMAAIPENVELVKKYGSEGLVFVGVHDAASGWDQADGVVKDKSINYPVALDKTAASGQGGASAGAYQVQFWPTYVVIDRVGTVRGVGLIPSHVEDAVKLLLAESGPVAAAASAEFAPEFFYGGEARPSGLKALEGKAAPKMTTLKWAGPGVGVNEQALANNVVVLHFFSPDSAVCASEMKKLAPVVKEMAAQGVMFVGICDGRASLEKAKELVKANAPAMTLAMDVAEAAKGDAAGTTTPVLAAPDSKPGDAKAADGKPGDRGRTAAAFGVKFAPATVVIDRAGRVRAAGVKADKVKAVTEKLLAEPVPAEKSAEGPK
jgi:thiol-disulfide isomerase/thioredoxin